MKRRGENGTGTKEREGGEKWYDRETDWRERRMDECVASRGSNRQPKGHTEQCILSGEPPAELLTKQPFGAKHPADQKNRAGLAGDLLSFTDVLFTSTTTSKTLVNIQTQSRSVSYAGYLVQLYFFLTFGDMDIFLLATIAYDCYVAICHPLHYLMIMSLHHCVLLVTACWTLVSLVVMTHTFLIFQLFFCSEKIIPDFCDLGPLMKVSCSDTQINELVLLFLGVAVILIPFLLILVSYSCIVLAIPRIPSAQGRHKTFSTCGPHLAVVALFLGMVIRAYLCPSSSSFNSVEEDTVATVMYTVVTSLLNPFIYSLQNKDLKVAVVRLLKGRVFFSWGK
ncbi:LOW QUALITY PROTEIN: olfactory receptor 1P1-like, partial [Cebus imitator]|uniref:LOW QUALITY PROTEIN: olfactory receptor 1P1-like n=1 Tax=Cebus imitator TaxID=2715852 RepID=UPI000809C8B0